MSQSWKGGFDPAPWTKMGYKVTKFEEFIGITVYHLTAKKATSVRHRLEVTTDGTKCALWLQALPVGRKKLWTSIETNATDWRTIPAAWLTTTAEDFILKRQQRNKK